MFKEYPNREGITPLITQDVLIKQQAVITTIVPSKELNTTDNPREKENEWLKHSTKLKRAVLS